MTLVEETTPLVSPDDLGRVHMAGIGGVGMSGIAHILLARGLTVSGCDTQESDALDALRAAGAAVSVGHDPGHIREIDTLVTSSAVRLSSPEVAEAHSRGVRVLPRAGALASVMADRCGVAVTGAHGKTTTTSLLVAALLHCEAEPSYLIGGVPAGEGRAARSGAGDIFVAEADESDGSFLLLSPHAAVVTNVEADHLDNYGSAEAVHDAFARFLDRISRDGFLICCADDPGARALAALARERGLEVATYGEFTDADLRIDALDCAGLESGFDLVEQDGQDGQDGQGRVLGRVHLRIPGRHNALNAAAALAAGLRLGFPFAELRDGVAGFTGVQRRFELKGEVRGVRVIDSYAHHPTEIAADLRTAREIAGEGRVIAAFQPHLYSRTRFFAEEFGQALGLADQVVVLDVYAAREEPEPGVSGALIAGAVPLPETSVRYEPAYDAVPEILRTMAEPGDVVLTLGAGNVTALGPKLVDALSGPPAGRAGE